MKTSNYTYKKQMSYSRKKYMGGIPGSKIVRFTMGNTGREFSNRIKMINLKAGQIKHNSLESARIAAMRHLEKNVERANFMLKIVTYPHEVLREHKRVNIAQADRFQSGMRQAFGKPVAVAARVKKRRTILLVEVEEEHVSQAKEALRKASHKMSLPVKILHEEMD